jgi:hypothetical protein
MKYGIELLSEQRGDGPAVERHESYRIRVKMWLNRGDPVRWESPWGLLTHAYLEDDGATLITDVRMDRVCLIPGLFYGLEGMRIGGTRRLRIPPAFAFGETGIPDRIPPNAMITAEVSVLAKRSETSTGQAEPQTPLGQ